MPSDCGENAACVEAVCACVPGFEVREGACVDVDECAVDAPCAAEATCTNVPGSFACACPEGFEGDGLACQDVDECSAGTAGCDDNASCFNEPGTYGCLCDEGYAGDGFDCADVNECEDGADDCDPVGGRCENLPGSFSCSCNPGFEGDGRTCVDVDECARGIANCAPEAVCVNEVGGFRCDCELGYTSDGGTCRPEFDIELTFDTSPRPDERAAFEAAEARWERSIVADLPDVRPPAQALEPCGLPPDTTTVDDLVIQVSLQAIDGPRGALGRAGPRCLRPGGLPPFSGTMILDRDDVASLLSDGRFSTVVLHEMGHVLGLGSLWTPAELLRDPSCEGGGLGDGADTRYVGVGGVMAWLRLGGRGEPPVENRRGQGSCDAHWREEGPLELELMSPILSATNPLSLLTLRSLADLGYAPAPDARADPFRVAPRRVGPRPPDLDLSDDLDAGPRFVLQPDGTLVRVR